jgi:hypothetical protein
MGDEVLARHGPICTRHGWAYPLCTDVMILFEMLVEFIDPRESFFAFAVASKDMTG